MKREFKIPNPSGLNAKVPKTGDFNRCHQMMTQKPTDKNQCAPTEQMPMRAHYKMAGGC